MLRHCSLVIAVIVTASLAAAPALGAQSGPYYGATLVDGHTGNACFSVSGSKIKNFKLNGQLIFASLTIKSGGTVSGTAKGVTLSGKFGSTSRFGGTLKLGAKKSNPFFARPRTTVDVKAGRCA